MQIVGSTGRRVMSLEKWNSEKIVFTYFVRARGQIQKSTTQVNSLAQQLEVTSASVSSIPPTRCDHWTWIIYRDQLQRSKNGSLDSMFVTHWSVTECLWMPSDTVELGQQTRGEGLMVRDVGTRQKFWRKENNILLNYRNYQKNCQKNTMLLHNVTQSHIAEKIFHFEFDLRKLLCF